MELSSILGLPLGLMTGAQFLTLMSAAYSARHETSPPATVTDVSNGNNGNKYAYGIKGICEIFGCSKPTAHRMKKSGVLNDAIIQSGRTIVIDRQKALDLVKEDAEKKKGGHRWSK
ncbi:MAG: DUF3853 family protein [Muribaculaceae bacterium]|nr:DUF3853 family protein [Muribaculaceae bacterium]